MGLHKAIIFFWGLDLILVCVYVEWRLFCRCRCSCGLYLVYFNNLI